MNARRRDAFKVVVLFNQPGFSRRYEACVGYTTSREVAEVSAAKLMDLSSRVRQVQITSEHFARVEREDDARVDQGPIPKGPHRPRTIPYAMHLESPRSDGALGVVCPVCEEEFYGVPSRDEDEATKSPSLVYAVHYNLAHATVAR